MKTLSALVFLLFATGIMMANAQPPEKKKGQLRHVVLVGFKETSSPDEIGQVIGKFEGLQKTIKQINAFEWGTNNSPENLNEGLTHAFVLTFKSEKDRDDYLVHPEHKKFVDFAGPHIGKVVVVDYWTK